MTRKTLFREALCGLLLGLFLMPAQPAQAFPVFDAPAHAQRIKAELKRAQEWAEKVRQYQQLYTNAVNQLTTLRGVLQTVDKELAKNMELARLTNDISEVLRGSLKLKRQIENQTRYQIAALQRIDDRLRNGIFDPDQDLRDFEEYLVYSMGRNSKQTIQAAVRTANADSILRVWMDERQDLAGKRAKAYEKLQELKKRLNQEKNTLDPSSTQPLNEAIYHHELMIGKLENDLTVLEEKIQQRLNAHGLRLSDMENFAYQTQSYKVAWRELQSAKDEIAKTFDAAVVGMKDAP